MDLVESFALMFDLVPLYQEPNDRSILVAYIDAIYESCPAAAIQRYDVDDDSNEELAYATMQMQSVCFVNEFPMIKVVYEAMALCK